MNKLLACLLLLCLIQGCAGRPPAITTLHGESLVPLRSEKVAVSYSLARKRINYLETLFRGVYLESKTSSQDFSGVWAPDRDLTGYTLTVLRAQGVNAVSVYDVVDAQVVEAANDAFGARVFREAKTEHKEIKGTKFIPNPNYFTTAPDAPEVRALYSSLKAQGFHYLIQLTSMDIYGKAIGYGVVQVMAQPNVRVVDLQSEKIIWSANYVHSELYQLGGDLHRLEADGMAKTKEGMQAGIAKLQFAVQMGIGNGPH
jgi:hypothetical protein